MKHTFLWFGILSNIVFLNLESAFSETLLKGQVTLRDKNGEPVNNAQISAIVGKANPVSTNSDGVFTLEFLDKDTGQKIKITCVKSGFDVVNWHDLETRLPDNPEASDALLQVVMCPQEGVSPSSCAVAYNSKYFGYNLAANFQSGNNKIQQEYADKLQQLEETVRDKEALAQVQQELLTAKNEQIAELERKYETALAQKEEWAKQFAEYDPATATDEMYKDALRLFQDNKLDEALAVLDDAKIQADLQRVQTQAANRYRLKAQSYVAKFDFANAEIYYQKAIDADPENLDNLHEFAIYLQNQNQFLKARPLYEKAMKLAKGEIEKVAMLGNLGVLYNDQNEYDKAADAFNRALTIYEALAAANPTAYRPYIAMTLNNLGLLYEDLNDYAKAADAYERARAIYEELAAANPTAYRPYVGLTLNNLVSLYLKQNDYAKAADAYKRPLNIYEDLAAENPQAYRPDLASTLNNLGVLYRNQNDYAKAADAYERALKIYEDLAATNPQVYRPDVAMTLYNWGRLYQDQSEYAKAADAYDRALQIREELAAANPTAYRPDVAMTLSNLGVLYSDLNEYDKAADAYERALQIREELAATNPTAYRADLASTLNNLGNLYQNQNEYAKAADAYERALKILEELAAANPQAYELDLCMTLLNLSLLYQTLYERDQQPTHKNEGLALAERAIVILQKYPNIPRAQQYLEFANDRKAFFEQAGE